MNSHFKFPRRVRIHGGECGAVARALHHKAQKGALTQNEQSLISDEKAFLRQADSGKAPGSTFNERKQMSTKTTLKRIALVAVSALGSGMLSTGVASAAAVTPTASTGFSLNTTSITNIVGTTVGGTAYGVFEVSLTSNKGIAAPLFSGETLTATVISNPNPNANGASYTSNSDLTLAWATGFDPATGAVSAVDTSGPTSFDSSEDGADAGYWDLDKADANRGGLRTAAGTTVALNDYLYTDDASTSTATYALKVYANVATAIDDGFFQIRISLLDANSNAIQSTIVKFQAVTDKVSAGGTLSITATGSQATGGALANSATQNIVATLADANGGLIRDGANTAPTLSGTLTDAATTPDVDTITWADNGGDEDADSSALDGTYVGAVASISNAAGTSTAKVLFGAATPATASVVITSTTGSNYGNVTISATGQVATSSGDDWNVPLTTKTATATFTLYSAETATATTTTRVASQAVYYTVDHIGCVLGDMTPAEVLTPVKATTDANGQVKIDITHANPVDGCSTTVTFTGSGVVTTPTTGDLDRTINWQKPTPTSVLKSPAGNYSAVLASTHKVTWTILDQFSTPVSGSTVTFTHTGANKPASTTTAPSAISDANGQVSYSWTDAKGVVDSATLGFDTVGISAVGTTTLSTGTVKVTYVATMPAIASLYSTYTATNASGTTITGLVPTSAIGGTTGVLTSTADQIDPAKTVTGATTGAWVQLNFQARKAAATTGTSGVPTTVTVIGAQLIGNDGKLGTTVTVYANENVHVLGTKAGTATVTATNGTITSTATINFVNAATDARVLSLKESAGLVTATVTDAFGSAVAGVTVDVVGSGGAWLGNGSTSASFTTATDGTVTFAVTNSGTVTASLAATYTKASFLAGAGNATGSVVTTGAPAGVRSVSVTTSGRADAAANAAEAATDAAAEAIDAANAATDAANLAAEAADAATVAAEEARDAADAATAAVEELATQVATLMAALKAQITTLANTVAKIAKKVKA